jgi:ribonuclease PH
MEENQNKNQVYLDGQPVDNNYLREQQQRTDIRIVMIREGEYKTLQRMQG